MPKCKITVLKKSYFPELVEDYCADPATGPCQMFEEGQVRIVDSSAYFNMEIPDGFCAEAWHAISHYVYAVIQGGTIMKGWMKSDKVMITCCNDGVRPVIFKLEAIDS